MCVLCFYSYIESISIYAWFTTKTCFRINLPIYLYPVAPFSLVTLAFISKIEKLDKVRMLDMHSLNTINLRAFVTLPLSITILQFLI